MTSPNNQLAEPVALDAKALEAAGVAFRATNYQGFLYGNRHVIRDINAKGTPEVWSLTTDEYDVGHAAMEIECDRLEMQAAIRAYLSALSHPAALSGWDSGAVDVAEEAIAGLCPRCAGTGRDPSTKALQCCKCMGSGAVVLRAALTVEPQGEAVPVAWLASGVGWKRVFLEKEAADRLTAGSECGNVIPLFTRPSRADVVTQAMVEAAWNLLNRGGYRIDGSAVNAALTAALAGSSHP